MSMTFRPPNKVPPFQGVSEINGVLSFLQNIYGMLAGSQLTRTDIYQVYWDMQSDSSILVPINANLNIKRIIGINFILNNDDESEIFEASLVKDGIEECKLISGTSNVFLSRVSGGVFDDSSFSDGDIQRGVLTLKYTT